MNTPVKFYSNACLEFYSVGHAVTTSPVIDSADRRYADESYDPFRYWTARAPFYIRLAAHDYMNSNCPLYTPFESTIVLYHSAVKGSCDSSKDWQTSPRVPPSEFYVPLDLAFLESTSQTTLLRSECLALAQGHTEVM